MSAPRIAYARELMGIISAALLAADLPKVRVTLDPRDIAAGSRNGVVLVAPPDIDFQTYTITDLQYELAVVAGPATNVLAAWERLDAILAALQTTPLGLQRAEATMFSIPEGDPVPGYVVTLNPDTVIEE